MAENEKTPGPSTNNSAPVPQAGTVITPNKTDSPPQPVQEVATPITHPVAPAAPAAPVPAEPAPTLPLAAPVAVSAAPPAPTPPPAHDMLPEQVPSPDQPGLPPPEPATSRVDDDGQSITWTASEFIAHDKSAAWYLMLAAGTLIIAVIDFIITRDKFSTGVIIVAGLLLGIYGSHKPRQLQYELNEFGIGIAGKYHSYNEFKSFSVVEEDAFAGIVFMPLKRFGVPLTIYYAPADENEILSLLTDRLPFEEHQPDMVDSFIRRIRF